LSAGSVSKISLRLPLCALVFPMPVGAWKIREWTTASRYPLSSEKVSIVSRKSACSSLRSPNSWIACFARVVVEAHTNTVESYFAILKRGITGTYHHVSQKHLKRYLAEFDFRYNERTALEVTDAERATKAVRGVVGKRVTYQQTNRDGRPVAD
jgi:hypothetical protein